MTCPAGAVPETAERDVQVVAEKARQRDVPPSPGVDDVHRLVRRVEVQGKDETEHEAEADGQKQGQKKAVLKGKRGKEPAEKEKDANEHAKLAGEGPMAGEEEQVQVKVDAISILPNNCPLEEDLTLAMRFTLEKPLASAKWTLQAALPFSPHGMLRAPRAPVD